MLTGIYTDAYNAYTAVARTGELVSCHNVLDVTGGEGEVPTRSLLNSCGLMVMAAAPYASLSQL